ncbi:MAG: flagellar filament capping protein FliD [Tepidisphaeraceae bacterium]|jgi:flagellar hook-associated protein 2
MGTITSGIGLVSGINYKDMIDQLMKIEQRPKDLLQKRIDITNGQKLAFTDLATRLAALKLSATTLRQASTFLNRSAASSNANVLSVSAASGAAKGIYQFQVSRLVSSQQAISAGFTDTSSAPVGAGTVTIELGGGEINSETSLAQLNGGAGVQNGQFRITDRSGRSGVIDITSALSLDDVVRKINTSLDISVKAQIQGNKLALTDLTGQTNSNLMVTDVGGGTAAANLGIAGSVDSSTLSGSTINYLGRSSTLAGLNDGRGIRTAGSGADFSITDSQGTSYDVTVGGLSTVGQVIDAINTATGGKVTASIANGATGITLTDSAGGGASPAVTAIGSSKAAQDLGLDAAASGSTIAGRSVLAGVDTMLLSSMRGGKGLDLGTVDFTDRAGNTTSVDFSGATNVQDVLDLINNNRVVGLHASLKDSGNGIQINDTSRGSGNVVIADGSSTTASELGIGGTFTTATATIKGANLQPQWVGENTLLSIYNGGRGVATGNFTITNSLGGTATIAITSTDTTIGAVLKKINAAGIGVTASINDNGDGILLTDTNGGSGGMIIADVTSQTAANLNIKGTANGNTIDGSFEKTFTISDTDTLDSFIANINNTGFAVSASAINDGSGAAANRLSLTSRFSGKAGRFVFDAGDTRLQTSNLVKAQNAAVFFGGGDTQNPVLITSSTNQLTNVVRGLTIDLNGVSASPVTVSVTDNNSNVLAELRKFVSNFNDLTDKIEALTAFNTDPTKRGVLQGDATVEHGRSALFSAIQSVVGGAGNVRVLADLGLKVVDRGRLELDESKFQQTFAADPENVKKFFTQLQAASGTTSAQKGMGTIIEDAINKLIDPVNGILTTASKTLDNHTQSFQNGIAQLTTLLAAKRTRLETRYAHLEAVLSQMQSQQQSLTSFNNSLNAKK